ncbi:MAG: inorganic phosphate transporter, partial [Prevotella sp.]|nr:inorganic phosphate transporter [Prevotella sp.]
IGGWFITAGAAFIMCYLVTNILFFGSFVAMIIAIIIAISLLIRSNVKYKSQQVTDESDLLFKQLSRTQDKGERWQLLKMHVSHSTVYQLKFINACFQKITEAFLNEEYSPLRQSTHEIETARKQLKRQRRREIIGLRKIEPLLAMERNTWYFLNNSNVEQMLYCLKRINDPCREHVGNNFRPVSGELVANFALMQKQIQEIFRQTEFALTPSTIDEERTRTLRTQAEQLQRKLSGHRQLVIDSIQKQSVNIESTIVYLNIVQESQQILSCLRHMLRGITKFCADE